MILKMSIKRSYDAVVIGSGPNGLAAGITLAQAGLTVAIYESKLTVGGGLRSAELTLPGFIHDICSAIHPLAIASPFFRSLPGDKYKVDWIQPLAPLAHPFDNGSAAVLDRSIDKTGSTLDEDAEAYKKLMEPFVENWKSLLDDILGPFHMPRHPFLIARFGFLGIRSAFNLSKNHFKGMHARGLFAGLAAHSIMPLEKPLTSSFALVLGILGHAVGWPIAIGGSQSIADALAGYFRSLGEKFSPECQLTTSTPLFLPAPSYAMLHQNSSCRSQAIVCRKVISASSKTIAMARAYSKSIGPSMGPFPGKPRNARAEGRFT